MTVHICFILYNKNLPIVVFPAPDNPVIQYTVPFNLHVPLITIYPIYRQNTAFLKLHLTKSKYKATYEHFIFYNTILTYLYRLCSFFIKSENNSIFLEKHLLKTK